MYLRSIFLSMFIISPLGATSDQAFWCGVAFVTGGLACAVPAVKLNLTWIRLRGQEQEHKKKLKELGATVYKDKIVVAEHLITIGYRLMHPYPCSQEKKEIVDKHFAAFVHAHKQIEKYKVGGAVTSFFVVLGLWIGRNLLCHYYEHVDDVIDPFDQFYSDTY